MRNNILANFVGRAWGIVSLFLFMPIYLKYLGAEAFGLVGFYSMLVGVVALVDLGITSTITRELARLTVRYAEDITPSELLRTYEIVYALISLSVALSIWHFAPMLATHWLSASALHKSTIESALRVMAIAIGFQLLFQFYLSGLMGLQHQVLSNRIQIEWGVIKALGAIAVLEFYKSTIYAFFCWQVIANGLFFIRARRAAWVRVIKLETAPVAKFRWAVIRQTKDYAIGVAVLSMVSIAINQLDKLVVSSVFPLKTLTYYVFASTISMVPYTLATPFASAVFPRLAELAKSKNSSEVSLVYHRVSELVAAIIIPVGITLCIFSKDILYLWTRSHEISENAGTLTTLLVGAQLLQAVTIIPYYLALAYGDTRLNFWILVLTLSVMVMSLVYAVPQYGLDGVGIAWLTSSVLTIPLYIYIFHRKFVPSGMLQWILQSILRPTAITLVCIYSLYSLAEVPQAPHFMYLHIGALWLIAQILCLAAIKSVRHEVFEKVWS